MDGGESWLAESVQSAWLSCEYLDVISIHAYGPGDLETSALQPYVTEAVNAGKMLIMEEWCVIPSPPPSTQSHCRRDQGRVLLRYLEQRLPDGRHARHLHPQLEHQELGDPDP